MSNNIDYIKNYNKNKYKMYQFRVRKDSNLVEILNEKSKRNSYIISLIEKDNNNTVLKLKDLKRIVKEVLSKYDIYEIYLFGSYARGEATNSSDVDILCEKGTIQTLLDQEQMQEELEKELGKKTDIVFLSSQMNEFFKEQIMEDLIKLC